MHVIGDEWYTLTGGNWGLYILTEQDRYSEEANKLPTEVCVLLEMNDIH